MDIIKIIFDNLARHGKVTTRDVVKATHFSRAYVHRFLQSLHEEGKISLVGKANQAHYVLSHEEAVTKAKSRIQNIHLLLTNKGLAEHEVLEKIKAKTGIFFHLRKNIAEIVDYAFLEMLNNAIDHSQSKQIKIAMKRDEDHLNFSIIDNGIGIFNNIMSKKHLQNVLDAIHDLLKGKQTTAPQAHSGEGIFFTSKAADILTVQGSNKKLLFDNIVKDVFVRSVKKIKGTKIHFTIRLNASQKLTDIFHHYTDDSYAFNKTRVTVKLYELKTQNVSRSEARRLLSGLDQFKTVILDFDRVVTIGQGFADEIFRLWKNAHPEITLQTIHANENVKFMIEHVTDLPQVS